MEKLALLNIEAFKIFDNGTETLSYGCDQQWFSTERQRSSGCGPSVASSILLYLNRSRQPNEETPCCKNRCTAFMEEVWEHVTPQERGIPSTAMFCECLQAYAYSRKINITIRSLDIVEEKAIRLTLSEVLAFLESSLTNDTPIAFLNLCNGSEAILDRWHWVTIISMERNPLTDNVTIEFLDEGIIKKIDVTQWYATTTLGGGFVSFTVH